MEKKMKRKVLALVRFELETLDKKRCNYPIGHKIYGTSYVKFYYSFLCVDNNVRNFNNLKNLKTCLFMTTMKKKFSQFF